MENDDSDNIFELLFGDLVQLDQEWWDLMDELCEGVDIDVKD